MIYECVGHRRRRSRAAPEMETNIFWTRFSYAAGEIPTHPPSWTHLWKSTSGKTKEEVDRQRQGGLQPTGVDTHWSRQSCTGSTSMAEHRTQLGLPAREDYIFVAKALSPVKLKVCILSSLFSNFQSLLIKYKTTVLSDVFCHCFWVILSIC